MPTRAGPAGSLVSRLDPLRVSKGGRPPSSISSETPVGHSVSRFVWVSDFPRSLRTSGRETVLCAGRGLRKDFHESNPPPWGRPLAALLWHLRRRSALLPPNGYPYRVRRPHPEGLPPLQARTRWARSLFGAAYSRFRGKASRTPGRLFPRAPPGTYLEAGEMFSGRVLRVHDQLLKSPESVQTGGRGASGGRKKEVLGPLPP